MNKNDSFDDLEAHMEEMEEVVESGDVARQEHAAVVKELHELLKRSPTITRRVLRLLSGRHANRDEETDSVFHDKCKPALVKIAHEHYMSNLNDV